MTRGRWLATDRRQPRRSARSSARRWRSVIAGPVVFAYLLLLVGWLGSRQIWGDGRWWLALLNSFPALWFLPVPVSLLLAAWAGRRVVWLAALIPLLIWLGVYGGRFLPKIFDLEASGPTVRVLVFNLLWINRDVDAIASAIGAADPDLVALPELTPAVDAALAERFGARYPYRTLHSLPGAAFGVGIYSRWPFDDLGSLQTGLGLRSAVVDVHTSQGDVHFLALHPRATLVSSESLEVFRRGIDESFRAREAQLAAVCHSLDEWGTGPVILAGDLNMTEFSDAYRCLHRRLHDGYRLAGPGFGHTWPATDVGRGLPTWLPSLTRIDYVFYSDHWRALDGQVIRSETGSDHRPVVLTLVYDE